MAKSTANSKESTQYSERATAAAHDVVDRVGEKAAHVEERIHEAADAAQRKAGDARHRAEDFSEEAMATTRGYVNQHPFASLAMAFGAGIVLSALFRRS
ncbi:MAG: hypothetical protein PVG66_06565 [Chromatiales bacterium]|jgi:ElaB/YqjD/DUF883 family membrane-anchored ribosome-binding protein